MANYYTVLSLRVECTGSNYSLDKLFLMTNKKGEITILMPKPCSPRWNTYHLPEIMAGGKLVRHCNSLVD